MRANPRRKRKKFHWVLLDSPPPRNRTGQLGGVGSRAGWSAGVAVAAGRRWTPAAADPDEDTPLLQNEPAV